MYGIFYKMLNALFQICSLTVAKLPLDEKYFELFYCNSPMIFGLVHAIFVLMAQGQMHCLITLNDAEGLVFLNLVFIHILY